MPALTRRDTRWTRLAPPALRERACRRSLASLARRLLQAGIVCILLLGPRPPSAAVAQVDLPRGPWVPSWEVLYGGFRQLDDLVVTGPGLAWGLDRNAFVDGRDTRAQSSFVRWEDGVWRSVQIVNDVGMTRMDIVGPTGFAVGDGGAIYRLVGDRWMRDFSPTSQDLTSLHVTSRNEAWASGSRGTLLFWDGVVWQPMALPPHLRLIDIPVVAGVGPGEAYAMAGNGEILGFDEGAWRVIENTPRILRPQAISFSEGGTGLFLGKGAWALEDGQWREIGSEDVPYRDAVWRGETAYILVADLVYTYRDRDWAITPLPNGLRYSGVAAAPDGIMAIGTRGGLVHMTEGQEGEFLWPGADPLEALDALSADFAWAGGTAITQAMIGSREGSWNLAQEAAYGTRVIDLDLASETDGWAVGNEPGARENDPTSARVWRWNGTEWLDFEVEKTWNLYEVQALSEDEAWASGSNVVARWDGSEWLQVDEAPFSARFAALSMLSGGESPEGWFGAEGEIYHMTGETWTAQPIEAGYRVPRLVVNSRTEGWAIARHIAGSKPDRLLRYDGQAWTPVALPIPDIIGLLDVDSPVPGTAWVLVDANGLLHWTGSAWEYHVLSPLGESIEPRRVKALKLDPDKRDISVWLAGGKPTVARYGVVEPRDEIYFPILGQSWRR